MHRLLDYLRALRGWWHIRPRFRDAGSFSYDHHHLDYINDPEVMDAMNDVAKAMNRVADKLGKAGK